MKTKLNITFIMIVLSFIYYNPLHSQQKEYSSHLYKYYINQGVKITVGNKLTFHEIMNLIYANPCLVRVKSNGFNSSEIIKMAEAGAFIEVEKYTNKSNRKLNSFDYEAMLECCASKLLIEYHNNRQVDLKQLLRNDIPIRIVENLHSSTINDLIRINPELVTIVSKNNQHNLKNYLTRGAKVVINHKMNTMNLETLIKTRRNLVQITYQDYSAKQLRKFVTLGAKVTIGKPFTREEITKIVQANPDNVTVKVNSFPQNEMQKVVEYGAKHLEYTDCNCEH